jgi:DNA replication protein DnaC
MNTEQTITKLSELRLTGMLRAYKSCMETGGDRLTNDEFLAYLVDTEMEDRKGKKYQTLIKSAKFRYKATIADIDFSSIRNIDKNTVLRLQTCGWIQKGQDIVITGATGTGKSYLASAIGMNACEYGYGVRYLNCGKMFSELKLAKADGSYIREINKLAKTQLIILDDFGLKQLDTVDKEILFEILDDRHAMRSTIITSQYPVKHWYELVNDNTMADAIMDRITNNSHRIEIKGDSMRKQKNQLD